MTYRLAISPQAKAEVRRNAGWWAHHRSSEEAALWLDTVQSQLESIVHFPESHPLSAENGEFPFEIRDKLLGPGARPSHRAVFSIQGDTIHVLTVRSGSQNALHPGDIESPP